MERKILVILSVILLVAPFSAICRAQIQQETCLQGVWDNFDFSRSAEDWAEAARRFGGDDGLVDLVVAQASSRDTVLFPFPFEHNGYLESYAQSDLVEPYLNRFDSEGLKVILSIQPLKSDVAQIIDILLSRYSHHSSIIGVNVDLEWKESGTPTYVSDQERDAWLSEMKNKSSNLRLFLTYFNGTHFPQDTTDLVILFDGERDAQANLLKQYEEIAIHYDSVGIYTGYSSSAPPSASPERILDAVPKTQFIIHTNDAFFDRLTLIFEMDDVQVEWNERLTISLLDLHLKKNMPLLCGVVPYGLANPDLGGGFLPSYLKDLHQNYFDIFEMAQLGYTNDDSDTLNGKNYQEQKEIMESGLAILKSTGIDPVTFVPSEGSADETTLQVTEELKFRNFVDLFENLSSSRLLILDSWVSLTETVANNTILKSPEQLMAEIDPRINEGVIILQYHVQDFAIDSKGKLVDLSVLIDTLKNSDKYVFMTARQYRETLDAQTTPPETTSQPPILPTWAIYLGIGISATAVLTILLVRMHRSSKKSSLSDKTRQTGRESQANVDQSQIF